MSQFSSMLNVFAYNYLKVNLICFDNHNEINLFSYTAFTYPLQFFPFLIEFAPQRLQSLKYTKLSLFLIWEMIPTCFFYTIFSFQYLQGRIL